MVRGRRGAANGARGKGQGPTCCAASARAAGEDRRMWIDMRSERRCTGAPAAYGGSGDSIDVDTDMPVGVSDVDSDGGGGGGWVAG